MALGDVCEAIMEFRVPSTHVSSLSFDLTAAPPWRPSSTQSCRNSVSDLGMDLGFVTAIHLSSRMGIQTLEKR